MPEIKTNSLSDARRSVNFWQQVYQTMEDIVHIVSTSQPAGEDPDLLQTLATLQESPFGVSVSQNEAVESRPSPDDESSGNSENSDGAYIPVDSDMGNPDDHNFPKAKKGSLRAKLCFGNWN